MKPFEKLVLWGLWLILRALVEHRQQYKASIVPATSAEKVWCRNVAGVLDDERMREFDI